MNPVRPPSTEESLRAENAELRARLEHAEEMLRVIRAADGHVLVVEGEAGRRLLTLQEERAAEQLRGRGEMIAQVSDAVIAVDLVQRITFLNAAAERLYGVQSGDMLGHKLIDIFARHWPSPEEEAAAWAALREHGSWQGRYLQRTHQGREVHVDSSFSALRDAHGEIIGYLSLIRDITERMRGEEALRASEARFRAAVGAVTSLLWTNNASGEMEGEQQAWGSFTGQSQEEYQGYGWAKAVHPDDAQPTIEAWNEAVTEKRPFEFEHRVRRHDGEWRVCDIRAVPVLGEAGEVREWVGVHTDITARKQAEETEKQSRERILMASEAAQMGFWSWRPDEDSVVWENEYPYRIIGVPPGSPPINAARFIAEFLYPDDAPVFEQAVARAVQAGERFAFMGRIRRPDGEARWVEFTGKSDVAENGRAPRIIGTVQDITARKQTEEQLRTSEARLRRVFESNVVGMIRWDLDRSLILDANAEFLRMTGYVRDDIASGRLNFRDLTPPEWAARNEEGIRAIRAEGHAPPYEKEYFRKDGSRLPLIIAGTRFEDSPSEGMSFVIDLTEMKQAGEALRESEARLGGILRRSPAGIVQTDASGRMMLVNARWCEMLGYPEAEMLGRSIFEITHPSSMAPTTEAVGRLAAGGPDFQIEKIYCRKDGSLLNAQSNVTALRSPTGEFLGIIGVVLDITERLRIEKEVREQAQSLARMAAIVESSHDALFSEDLDGIVLSWNPGAEQIFGYRADEIVGTSIMRLIPEARQDEEHELQRKLSAGEHGGTLEAIRQRKDGREFDASITISPLKDAAGKVIGTSRVVRDITERRRVEEAARQNAALFTALIAQAPMGTYVVDAEFRMMQINATALPIFASVEPLLGRDFGEVMAILWGPEVGKQCADIFRHTLATGEAYISPPFTEKRHDLGITQTYEWQTQRVTLPDGAKGVVCYFHEVTERTRATEALRMSRERMRLAAEATGVGIWEWNVATNTVHWDAVMFDIYGIPPTPDGLVQYSDWSGAVLPEELAENEAILQDTLRRCGQSTRSFRIRRRNDGECRHIEAVETVRVDAAGQAAVVVGTNLDVTAQKNAERAIREEALRKDEFLAMLGHELRNPLNAIRHAVQIGHETPEDGEACQWAAEVIDRQSQQLSRMVDDLLDVARINRGRIELRPETLDVGAVVERAVAAVQPLIVQRRHTLVREVGTQLTVTGDAARLEQVFVNLLTNAAKYTPEDGRISIRAHHEDGQVVVAITDNGTGIPSDLLPHVFDLFRQADSTLDRALGGLGIGLNVVKSLVEMHLGHVTVESAGANAGTTVTVRLPLLVELPAPASAPILPTPADALPHSTRVLVVDDHEDAARALARLLKLRGCEVALAHTGPDGVATAREFLPEVLLIDLGLPGFDGFEVARLLRAEAPFAHANFIALSGYAQSADRARCLVAGFDEHFAKPYDFPKLMEAIHARRIR